MPRNCTGLDIGSSSVKMIELKQTKGGYELLNYGVEPLPPETIVDGTIMNQGAIVDAIRALSKKLRLRNRQVALAIAGHFVIVKKIAVPKMTPEELEEHVPWEAQRYIPFGKDDVEIDHEVLGSQDAQGQTEILLVAAKKEVVADYAAVARQAQLKPEIVDVAAFALQNAFELNYTLPPNETVALVHVGAAISTINIVMNGTSLLTRDVTIGGNAFTEEIQKQLAVAYDEAEAYKVGGSGSDAHEVLPHEVERVLEQVAESMAGEFQRSLDYFLATSADATLSRIFLSGGTAKVSALQRAIEKRSRLPVELLDPFARVKVDEAKFDMSFVRAHAPEAAIAVGLALRQPGDT